MHKVQHVNEKELDILEYFYRNRRGHVRQIKKSILISEHTLLKYLHSLEKRKMIFSRKEGNLKMYELNKKSQFVKIFFSYFDIKRLENLEYIRKRAISNFIDLLHTVKIPYFILLFGSSAKGDYTKRSDIDMIVTYDAIDRKIQDKIDDIKKAVFAETGIRVNAITMRLDEFIVEMRNEKNFALQDALMYGYPIFGNQIYYEVVQ